MPVGGSVDPQATESGQRLQLCVNHQFVIVAAGRGEGALLHATELGEPAHALAPSEART